MRIRPPVVREMRHNLWAKMMDPPNHPRVQPGAASPKESEIDIRLDRLKTLSELRASGVLTEDEFERVKAKVLPE
jgi:Short C-terminal domain